MQVPADDLDTVMAGLAASRNVDGILVTMPHRFTAFAHCATSSERASTSQAECRRGDELYDVLLAVIG